MAASSVVELNTKMSTTQQHKFENVQIHGVVKNHLEIIILSANKVDREKIIGVTF